MTAASEDLRDQAERAVLGACLINSGAIEQVAQILRSADFYRPHHATIYATIITMWAAGDPVDPITVTNTLLESGDLNRVGGAPYVYRLVSETPAAASASHYARTVAERSQRRRLSEIAAALEQSADLDNAEMRHSLLANTHARLSEIIDGRLGGDPADAILDGLLCSADLDNLPELAPLIPGVLYRDSIAWLAGRPGRGKTLVALDMAGSIATGLSWHGYRVVRSDVWYIIAEGAYGMRDRVRAWEELAQRPMTGVSFYPRPVQASDAAAWSALCRAAARRRPGLIVLDTQARVTVGMDENSAIDMGTFVERVEQLRGAAGSCVLTLHHTPRNGDHLRGHSTIEGAAQTIIMARKDGNVITLHNTEEDGGKQKDGQPFDPIHLRITPAASHVALVVTDRASEIDVESPQLRELLRQWWETWESDEVSKTAIRKADLVPERTLDRYLTKLRKSGVIERTGPTNRASYRLLTDPTASI